MSTSNGQGGDQHAEMLKKLHSTNLHLEIANVRQKHLVDTLAEKLRELDQEEWLKNLPEDLQFRDADEDISQSVSSLAKGLSGSAYQRDAATAWPPINRDGSTLDAVAVKYAEGTHRAMILDGVFGGWFNDLFDNLVVLRKYNEWKENNISDLKDQQRRLADIEARPDKDDENQVRRKAKINEIIEDFKRFEEAIDKVIAQEQKWKDSKVRKLARRLLKFFEHNNMRVPPEDEWLKDLKDLVENKYTDKVSYPVVFDDEYPEDDLGWDTDDGDWGNDLPPSVSESPGSQRLEQS